MHVPKHCRPDAAVSPVIATVFLILITATIAGLALTGDWWQPRDPIHADIHAQGEDRDDDHATDTLTIELHATGGPPTIDATARIQTPTTHATIHLDDWNVGQRHALPCLEDGHHQLTISTQDRTVEDVAIHCGEPLQISPSTTQDDETTTAHPTPFYEADDCERSTLDDLATSETGLDRLVDLCQAMDR